MVAETQAPGAAVSIVARRHDVNSNQLFRWRRQLLPKAVVESGAMMPVEIAPDDGRPRRTDREGVIARDPRRKRGSHLTPCWRRQSRANPSQFPDPRENTGNLRQAKPSSGGEPDFSAVIPLC